MLIQRERLSHEEEAMLMNALGKMSMQQARKCRDNILDRITLEMPKTFATKDEYLAKLQE